MTVFLALISFAAIAVFGLAMWWATSPDAIGKRETDWRLPVQPTIEPTEFSRDWESR